MAIGLLGRFGAMDYGSLGFVKVAAAAPPIAVADPAANAKAILEAYAAAPADAAIVLLPELAVTGYSCEDLFFAEDLRRSAEAAVATIAAASGDRVLVFGAPWRLEDGRLLNCAFVCQGGAVAAATPKLALPNYDEFYEQRWFASGRGVDVEVEAAGGRFPLREGLICRLGETAFGIELCEDLWLPNPPTGALALGGAEILLNLSASPELIGKAAYRRELVRSQSARTISAYVYASAGPTESTKDVVFGGHLLAAENGHLLAESERFALAGASLSVEVDCQRLRHDRLRNSAFAGSRRAALGRAVPLAAPPSLNRLARRYPRTPFVPTEAAALNARAEEALSIQATGLARRMAGAAVERLVIGISGGLDSTLAYLACLDALEKRGLPPARLEALTLPGPGTTQHTIESARLLAAATGVALRELDITEAVHAHLDALGHDGAPDVTFENAQARERTQILFDVANQIGGIVVGTGDLSELALGWCTFNADQTAGYNVNAGVPKTLVASIVRWYAEHRASAALRPVLERVLATPITPELTPVPEDGAIGQRTEEIVGPFELHDFFLFHFLRGGTSAEKLLALATRAFEETYSATEVARWLRVFLQRFFAQQFKRTTLPPGPKVGTVSLSPRGDWRMPDEASASAFLAALLADADPSPGDERE